MVRRWLGSGVTRGDEEAGLLAIFDEIGRARRAFGLIGCGVVVYMSSEVNPSANRVLQYAWLTRVDVGPVQQVTGVYLAQIMHSYPRVRYLYVVGGFPCKGFSLANPDAKGLASAQSVLLFELVRVLRELEDGLVGARVRVRFLAECVASIK